MTAQWILGDSLSYMDEMPDGSVQFVCADPPYSTFPLINDAIARARRVCAGPSLFFMYAEDLCQLDAQPDQVLFWVKPVSTKNTSRRYSRFVEVIALFDSVERGPLNQEMHWSNRTGVFTDAIMGKQAHPWEKPRSLIERLVLNHTVAGDIVLDPFAGVGTTGKVAALHGRGSVNIEIDEQWVTFWPDVTFAQRERNNNNA